MKTNLLILSILLCIGAKNYAQNVNIPDAIFKDYLVNQTATNPNGDSEIQVSEAIAFTGMISVPNKGISDLTGIEAFTAITSLNCSNNYLTSLDVSNNPNLLLLYCYQNQLTSLNVSNNTALKNLDCTDNVLTSLDVTNCVALTSLYCRSNQLTSLDVTNCPALTYLNCRINQLSSLDVTNNTALETIYCYGNQLTSLDVTNNTALKNLYCYENQLTALNVADNIALVYLDCKSNLLTSLDVTNNINLYSLRCQSNLLTSLNVAYNINLNNLSCEYNQLTSLDISNNTYLQYLNCVQNPNLYCIQVSNVTLANTNLTGGINANMYFSLDCSNVSTAENLATSLSILPNPASDYLYISYEGEKKLSFAISDIWGKTLAAWETTSTGAFYQKEVPIADFSAGIYFLSAQAGDKKVVKKFVKE